LGSVRSYFFIFGGKKLENTFKYFVKLIKSYSKDIYIFSINAVLLKFLLIIEFLGKKCYTTMVFSTLKIIIYVFWA